MFWQIEPDILIGENEPQLLNFVTLESNFGSSFYQSNLMAGEAYLYRVTGIGADGTETTLGQVRMSENVGPADSV